MTALKRADLSKFFAALARRLPSPALLILTGGSEAMLLGGRRPTGDIDFGLVVSNRHSATLSEIEAAIAAAARDTKVNVQYSTDIDRWSLVAIPKGMIKTRYHKRLGQLSIHLLDPRCWAVYKLARYLDSDIEDLLAVLKRQKVSWTGLARLCGECLRSSPRSTRLFLFRRQVEHFFREHGKKVWGRRFETRRAIAAFHRAAKILASQKD